MTPIPQAVLDAWANCSTPDCPNKRCMWLSPDKCFPCATGTAGLGYEKCANNAERNAVLEAAGTLDLVRVAYAATHPGKEW